MKTITIKTPPARYAGVISNTIPHLLEHITTRNFKLDPGKYFNYIIDTEASTYYQYTTISIPDAYDEQIFVEMITKPFTQEIYELERRSLLEELQATHESYIDLLQEKVGKRLYGNEYISNSQEKPLWDEVVAYHKKRYTPENILITDKDDALIFAGSAFSLELVEGTHGECMHIDCIEETQALAFPYLGRKNHRLAFFIYDLLKNYNRFEERYNQGNYFYEDIEFFHHKSHIIVAYPQDRRKGA